MPNVHVGFTWWISSWILYSIQSLLMVHMWPIAIKVAHSFNVIPRDTSWHLDCNSPMNRPWIKKKNIAILAVWQVGSRSVYKQNVWEFWLFSLKSIGLVAPYGDTELSQHWFRHQAVALSNVDISSDVSCVIHLRATSQEMHKIPSYKMCLKIKLNYKRVYQGPMYQISVMARRPLE